MATAYAWTPPPQASVAIAGSDARFPVRRIYCVGRNYADHVREMGGDPGKDPPIFFTKPADAVTDTGVDVAYPPETASLHHEVELVVALRSGGAAIAPQAALQHVFGYAVGNDLTRRDLQHALRGKGLPWDMSKAFDQSAQVAPLCPAARFGVPDTQSIWLTVNGQPRQRSSLAHLIWTVPEVIATLSRFVQLAAGDLIFTGTPDGVGPLERGDVVRAGIGGLEPLEFRISG